MPPVRARRLQPWASPVLLEPLEPRRLMTAVLDLMVVYTPALLASHGQSSVNDLITQGIDDTNTVLANSLIDARVNLVFAGEINYTESNNLTTDLNRLTNHADGYMDAVQSWRDFYGADMVALLVNDSTDGNAGLGWQLYNTAGDPANAYSVLLGDSAPAPDYTLAHELGHNLGAGHDFQTDPGGGLFSYSYGWRFTANGKLYHDIMAYDPGTTVPYYSSPQVYYQGVPTGTATADNARTIRYAAPTVAGYRPPASGAPTGGLDLVDPGRLGGWALDRDTPYDPVTVRIDIDGTTYGTVSADQTRSDLEAATGTTDHGFTYLLPSLAPGHHRVDVYGLDTGDNTPTLLAERDLTITNWLFDENAYLAAYPDVAAAVANHAIASGYDHYVAYGQHEGRSPSPFFDESYYLATYPDVAAAVRSGAIASGLAHYLQFGQAEQRNPSPYFDEPLYRALYPDVAAAVAGGSFSSGFEHFVLFGQAENRRPSLYFDPAYYATNTLTSGLPAGYRSGFEHFLLVGNVANDAPFDLFDPTYYLQQNPDVAAALSAHLIPSAFDHWLRYGRHENRRFSTLYSEATYLAYNPDVAAAVQAGLFDSGLTHYLRFGRAEGRRAI